MFISDRQRKAVFARMGYPVNRFSVSTGSGVADAVVNTIPDSFGDVGSTPNKVDDFVVGFYPGSSIKDKFDEIALNEAEVANKMVDLAAVIDFKDSLKILEIADHEARHGMLLSEMGVRYNDRGFKA